MVIDPTSPTRDINKRLLLTLHQDGLLDILAGLIVLTFGFIPILDDTGMNPGIRQVIIFAFYGLSIVLILWLKRRITLPRSGFVKLSRKTSSRISLSLLAVNILLFLFFTAVYLFDLPVWEYFGSLQLAIPLGLVFLIMLTVTGAMLKASRFYLYGILVALLFVLFEYLFTLGHVAHHGIPLATFLSGGIIVASGGIHLYRFMSKYSVD